MNKDGNAANEKLFGSRTRAKLLELFFANTNKSFYVREITRVIGEQIHSVRRELTNLESIGVVRNETFDNKIYYTANMKHAYARAFAEMFGAPKPPVVAATVTSVGGATQVQVVRTSTSRNLDEYIRPVAKYLRALMMVNRLPGQEGVDMLIIGDDRTKKLSRLAEILEQKNGKPLNYVILERDDFLYRKSVRDRFIMDILEMEVLEMYDPEKVIRGEKVEK